MSDYHADHECGCASTGATQSLDEMEFERGIWQAAIDDDDMRLLECVENGDIDKRDNCGYTALHYAARKNRICIVKRLCSFGADINARTNGGATALYRAAMMGHIEIVKLLILNGANVNTQDNDGNNALHRAVLNGSIETIKLLHSTNGALCSVANANGQTPLDIVPNDTIKDILTN